MKINILLQDKTNTVNEREKQIINVSLINILALLNAVVTQKKMVTNPLAEHDKENLGFEVFLSNEVIKEEQTEFKRRVANQLGMFFEMAEIPYQLTIED